MLFLLISCFREKTLEMTTFAFPPSAFIPIVVGLFGLDTGILTFLRGSRRAARALVGAAPTEHGMTFWRFVFGSGLVLPWLLQTLSLIRRSRQRRAGGGLLISLLVLVGGYFLRRTMIEAGHTSSADARTTLWNAKK